MEDFRRKVSVPPYYSACTSRQGCSACIAQPGCSVCTTRQDCSVCTVRLGFAVCAVRPGFAVCAVRPICSHRIVDGFLHNGSMFRCKPLALLYPGYPGSRIKLFKTKNPFLDLGLHVLYCKLLYLLGNKVFIKRFSCIYTYYAYNNLKF